MSRSTGKTISALDPTEMGPHAGQVAALPKALAHPARPIVVCRVKGECSMGDLQPLVAVSMSALSRHLAVLREMGLVATRRDSQTIHYSLVDEPAFGVLHALYDAYCTGEGATP